MRSTFIVCLAAVLAGSWLLPAEAMAADDADVAAALPGVEITLVGDAEGLAVLEARAVSWFRGQGTTVSSGREPVLSAEQVFSMSDRPGVRVWIVLRSPGGARLFFVVQERVGEEPRYLVQDVELEGGLDELGVEHVAQVCYLSATALWAGNSLESSRQEVALGLQSEIAKADEADRAPAKPQPKPETTPARPLQPAARPKAARSQRIVRTGLEFAARYQGEEEVAFVPGAAVGGGWRREGLELGGLLHAGLFLPRTVQKEGVELELSGATFGLGFALAKQTARHWWLGLEVGPGFDVVRHRTALLGDETLRASPSGSDVRPFGYVLAGIRGDFSAVSLSLAASLAAHFTRTHYDIGEPGTDSELIVPWLVQPGVCFGASWAGP